MSTETNTVNSRVMLVYSSAERSRTLLLGLRQNDYDIASQLPISTTFADKVYASNAGVLLLELEKLDNNTLSILKGIIKCKPLPVIVFAAQGDSETIGASVRAGISAFVVDGIEEHRIKPIIDAAVARFREHNVLRRELEKAKTTLAERKLIDRAKGILMKQRCLSEAEAYKTLRVAAMDNNQRIADVAKQILSVAKLIT